MVKIGFISFVTETPSGQDANGNPVAASKVYSQYYPCNIATVRKEYKSFVDGQWKDSTFKIIIDNVLVESIDLEPIKEVALQDLKNKSLGNFQIQNIEYLALTNRTKIVV